MGKPCQTNFLLMPLFDARWHCCTVPCSPSRPETLQPPTFHHAGSSTQGKSFCCLGYLRRAEPPPHRVSQLLVFLDPLSVLRGFSSDLGPRDLEPADGTLSRPRVVPWFL